jgi:Tol biopolymer transport system component
VRVARRSGALPVLVALSVLVPLAPALAGSFPGGDGRIVFAEGNLGLLWTINPDGSDSRSTTVRGSAPAASPDGRFVAFACSDPVDGSGEICVMRPDGAHPHPITDTVSGGRSLADPAWAPDGTHLIATGYKRDGSSDLFMVNAFSGALTNLTSSAAVEWNAAWSPLGTQIAFNRYQADVGGIWVMNADGSDARRLGDGMDPSWSPDGGRIAFADARNIWTMAPDGGGRRQITVDEPFCSVSEAEPAWSPDGASILFTRPVYCANGTSDVYVMDADGENQRPVTFGFDSPARFNIAPDWIPAPGSVFTPDAAVKRYFATAVTGDNVYSLNGKGQTVTNVRPPGGRARFEVFAQNDGNASQMLRVSGCRSSAAFDVRYSYWLGARASDATSKVTRGRLWTFELGPGGYVRLFLEITARFDTPVGAVKDCLVQVHSSHDLHATDGVRARLVVIEEPPD